MSMKRPEPLGGVDGRRCDTCCEGDCLRCGGGAEAVTVGIASFAFGGRPRRILGEPVAVTVAVTGADAGGIGMSGGDCRASAEEAD